MPLQNVKTERGEPCLCVHGAPARLSEAAIEVVTPIHQFDQAVVLRQSIHEPSRKPGVAVGGASEGAGYDGRPVGVVAGVHDGEERPL